MSCVIKTLEGSHVEPEMSCIAKSSEDTSEVSLISCTDNALEDTHVVFDEINEVGKMCKRERQVESRFQNKRKIINSEMIRRKKIFVGGLPSGISEDEFKEYFERFGTITDVVVMRHSVTNRPRGFGFITFHSEKSVEDVMVNSFYDLNGKQVEVKRVTPKVENPHNGAFDQLRYNNGSGTSLESFPYYGSNMIPNLAYDSLPWYNNNGLYVHGPNPFDWYPTLGASLPWCMFMSTTIQPYPESLGYYLSSYPCVGGNVVGQQYANEILYHNKI
ncbi:hypothetical protein Fmac_031743 [Flemingia macrophylla]|uniref:RRM domain-containing protein n=1 Tax=Flemingia macrophylla TaxID=520843 RepID=A0ABD1L2X8_9FABA